MTPSKTVPSIDPHATNVIHTWIEDVQDRCNNHNSPLSAVELALACHFDALLHASLPTTLGSRVRVGSAVYVRIALRDAQAIRKTWMTKSGLTMNDATVYRALHGDMAEVDYDAPGRAPIRDHDYSLTAEQITAWRAAMLMDETLRNTSDANVELEAYFDDLDDSQVRFFLANPGSVIVVGDSLNRSEPIISLGGGIMSSLGQRVDSDKVRSALILAFAGRIVSLSVAPSLEN